MADRAIAMAREGAERIICLGVDFMSENVRAMLDAAGYAHIPVYRAATAAIGCTLAEAAEAPAYGAYLAEATATPRSLHVIYINTSLRVKAKAHHRIPTITCTSSNVVKTVLQAAAQIDDVHVWFGPDTYMGENLTVLLEHLARLDDERIAQLHPAHDRRSIAALRERFHYFRQGTCVVHQMFGADVAHRIARDHEGAYVTAHFEVPGEMFALGLAAEERGAGVVGSTSNILSFIEATMAEAARAGRTGRVPFILGTESGMVTAIVQHVQRALRAARPGLAAEIIFPVASEAITQTDDPSLPIVPGAAGGEGCTVTGGCATCPYMKMNSLASLREVLGLIGTPRASELSLFHPKTYTERVGGVPLAELGGRPILHMRHFSRTGLLPDDLVTDVLTRASGS
jgi:quinolinate synthase